MYTCIMGNLLSSADVGQEVTQAMSKYNIELARLQRNIHREGCPGLTVTDMRSLDKYRRTPLKGSWTLADSGPMSGELHEQLCTAVRLREGQKVFLGKQVVASLMTYGKVLELLIQGDYCASSTAGQMSMRDKTWQITGSSAMSGDCAGVYRPPYRTVDGLSKGDLSPSQVYRLTDPENVRWKEIVDTLKTDFSSAWRRLKRVMKKLLVDEILPIETLIDLKKTITETVADIEESFQNFMSLTLDGDDPITPMSTEVVKRSRLQRAVDMGELAAQQDVIKSAGRDSRNNMFEQASAHWKSPLNALNTYGNQQQYGGDKKGRRSLRKKSSKRLRRSRKANKTKVSRSYRRIS